MSIKENIKGTAASTFNTLTGKKGIAAAFSGQAAVWCAGAAVIVVASGGASAPLLGVGSLVLAGVNATKSHNAAKSHARKKGLTR